MPSSRRLSLASVVLLLAACSAAGSTEDPSACSQGSDCVSGVCSADGVCVEAAGGGAGAGGQGTGGQGAGAGGQGPGAGAGGEAAGAVGGPGGQGGTSTGGKGGSGNASGSAGTGSQICQPNNDGTITREETPLVAGVKASYRRATDAAVNSAGEGSDPASKTWDFTAALENDTLSVLETQPIEGTWYADKFPGASYSLKLSATSELRGVFQATPEALNLLGVVSPTGGDKRTELTYATPVKVLSFPMKLGSTWTTTTSASGYLYVEGTLASTPVFNANYLETYETTIDAAGTVKTPLGTYTALRLNLVLTRNINSYITKTRTFAFSAECFGTVARLVSADAIGGFLEPDAELSKAAEYTRLAP